MPIRVGNYEEALHVANDTTYGLSSGICTTSLKYASDFKRQSAAGMVMVNVPTAGVDYHASFGGHKGRATGPVSKALMPASSTQRSKRRMSLQF